MPEQLLLCVILIIIYKNIFAEEQDCPQAIAADLFSAVPGEGRLPPKSEKLLGTGNELQAPACLKGHTGVSRSGERGQLDNFLTTDVESNRDINSSGFGLFAVWFPLSKDA